jgi:ParB-like nuclease domain
MLMTGSSLIDAQTAFSRAARARRRAALAHRLWRRPAACRRLPVYGEDGAGRAVLRERPGVREIPLRAIRGTLEPARAEAFDADFRPAPIARARWQRVWLAEQRGLLLPPISVVPVDGGYAVRDGHHRVSVARSRGALTIDASVDPTPLR